MKIVFIVEDDDITIQYYEAVLTGFRLIWADTVESAIQVFDQFSSEIDIVVLDCCLYSRTPNTMPILKHILKNKNNIPVIAKSSEIEYAKKLVKMGAIEATNNFTEIKALINKRVSITTSHS